jgi:hypothetical protein
MSLERNFSRREFLRIGGRWLATFLLLGLSGNIYHDEQLTVVVDPTEKSIFNFLDLSRKLAVSEKELSSPLKGIKKEDLRRFAEDLTPKILEIYREKNLSWGVWVENSFKPEDRTGRIPDFFIENSATMSGRAAQTNYREGRIRLSEDLFNSEGECSVGTAMFLLAHELAHFSGTTDELYRKDDLTNESAAQLVALEGLAYGYFKYRESDSQLALLMLVGFLRTLRRVFEDAALYYIISENKNLDSFKDYLKNLPNTDEKENRLKRFLSKDDINVESVKQAAYYYGWLPLQTILGRDHSSRLLFGNPQKRIELKSTKILLCEFFSDGSSDQPPNCLVYLQP